MPKVFVSQVSCVMPPRSRRTTIEALMVWAPILYRVIGDLIMRTLPYCKLRRAIVRSHTLSGWAGICRRDYDLTFVRYMHDVVYEVDGGFQTLGLKAKVSCRKDWAEGLAEWSESWAWWGLEPLAIIDMENRLVGLGRFRARGLNSGIEVDEEYAQLVTLRPGTGMVQHEHDFINWKNGLLAAGLDPEDYSGLLADLQARSGTGSEIFASARGNGSSQPSLTAGIGRERVH